MRLDIVGVYLNGLTAHTRRGKRQSFEQTFHHGMQASRTNIFALLVYIESNFRNAFDAIAYSFFFFSFFFNSEETICRKLDSVFLWSL